MPACVPLAATAGSAALRTTRGAHPTLRMDAFLRNTDATYQHAEAPQGGDRFIRQMATYGNVRPSPCFIAEARARRPVINTDTAMDMSSLPAPWNDPTGHKKEGTLVVPQPSGDGVSNAFAEMCKNDALMLPSERRAEAKQIVAGEKQWREDRQALFKYKKQIRTLEMKHPDGVEGIDGPMYPETRIYAEKRAQMQDRAHKLQTHAEGRFARLERQMGADDATTRRNYGTDPNQHRSEDICAQRKFIDREVHPVRFQDTHSRIFPKYVAVWDPGRAQALRSHDVRDKSHNIVSGGDNAITFEVAGQWGLPAA
mmetsp:Transcript_119497/g.315917  ORF Transcript_119497/g.315917 Transcript_119497/m.315917 type:complete len:312 (-) Transcript_119497:51-986(-)